MEFVDDYKAKKKLADKLRARADRLNSLGVKDFSYGATTGGSGAFPGMTQANWSAPLAQLGTAIASKVSESRAENAEEEANQARLDALNSIMGSGAGAQGAGGTAGQTGAMGAGAGNMTPEKVMALGELGVDPRLLKMLAPKQQSMGAITQAARDPAAREALVGMNVITREQADAMAAAQAAAEQQEMQLKRDQYTWEQNNKRFAPTQGRAPSDFEMYQQNPELYQKYIEAKNAGKGSSGGKGGKGGVDPETQAEHDATNIKVARDLINDPKNKDMFGPTQRFVAAANNYMDANPDEMKNVPGRMFISPMESPAAAVLKRIGTEQSFARVKELYPASNSDIALARSLSANVFQNKEAANAFLDHMEMMQKKYPKAYQTTVRNPRGGPGQADGEGVGAGATGSPYKSSTGISFTVDEE